MQQLSKRYRYGTILTNKSSPKEASDITVGSIRRVTYVVHIHKIMVHDTFQNITMA